MIIINVTVNGWNVSPMTCSKWRSFAFSRCNKNINKGVACWRNVKCVYTRARHMTSHVQK